MDFPDELNGKYLNIIPGMEMLFNQRGVSNITMTNTHSKPVAFKVKSNAPDHYSVKNSAGIIPVGQSTTTQIYLYKGYKGECIKDRFLVLAIELDEVVEAGELTARWASASPEEIMEHRLRCFVDSMGLSYSPSNTGVNEAVELLSRTVEGLYNTNKQLEVRIRKMVYSQFVFMFLLALASIFCVYLALTESGNGYSPCPASFCSSPLF